MSKLLFGAFLLSRQDLRLFEDHQVSLLGTAMRRALEAGDIPDADLGATDRQILVNRLAILISHLLKWEFCEPARRPRWQAAIRDQRQRIVRSLHDLPHLSGTPRYGIAESYPIARRLAATETGLGETAFPPDCPYSPGEVLDPAFFPAAALPRLS